MTGDAARACGTGSAGTGSDCGKEAHDGDHGLVADAGVHVNILGAGVALHARNRAQALDMLEWLSTRRPQAGHARMSLEYPVNRKAYPPRIVAKWGKYRQDQGNLSGAGRFGEQAAQLMNRAGYR